MSSVSPIEFRLTHTSCVGFGITAPEVNSGLLPCGAAAVPGGKGVFTWA